MGEDDAAYTALRVDGTASNDRWVACGLGHRHWGAAGLRHDRRMRIVEVNAIQPRAVEKFGSRRFTVGILCPDAYVTAATLEADGIIGRHSADVDQCLLVIEGRAFVSGADGSTVEITAGQAALWLAGEHHETRTDNGARLLIVEGEGLAERLN